MTRIRCQKGILYLRVERCRILYFLFQIRGGGGWYLSVGIFLYWYNFSGETFMGKFLYNNITIFHLKLLNYQLHNTFLWYSNVSGALYRMTLLSEAIQKDIFYYIFIALTAGSLFLDPYVYKYMILVSCKLWTWQCTVLIKITFDFRCIFAFNF